MLRSIITEKYTQTASTNSKIPYNTELDLEQLATAKADAITVWQTLSPDDKKRFGDNPSKFLRQTLGDAHEDLLNAAKNYGMVRREVGARINDTGPVDSLPISSLYIERTLLELIENLENVEHIKILYKNRKKTLGDGRKSGLNTTEAVKLKNCLRQGRELYCAGKSGPLVVKPLNFFYSITAYAYCSILLNSPTRYSLDQLPGHHGIDFKRSDVSIQFGGDTAHGTLSELICAYPSIYHKSRNFDFTQDNTETVLQFFHFKHDTSIATLLSMIPEMREYYTRSTRYPSRAHPLQVSTATSTRDSYFEFQIGDGQNIPSNIAIENAFPGRQPQQNFGKIFIRIPANEVHNIRACIYTDAMGDLWFIDNPFYPIVIPEICIHFLLIFAFSNIMRYAPDVWGELLLNNADATIPLITQRYISTFESKLPFLVLSNISQLSPFVSRD